MPVKITIRHLFFVEFFLIYTSKLSKMKPLLLIISLLIFLKSGYSQNNAKTTYSIIRIETAYDYSKETYFRKIVAESITQYSKEIGNLISYNNQKKATNTGATFYSARNDTTSAYFNYFSNTTEAIQFMANNHWQLISIYNEISSNYENIREAVGEKLITMTKITSRPVYYFRKDIP